MDRDDEHPVVGPIDGADLGAVRPPEAVLAAEAPPPVELDDAGPPVDTGDGVAEPLHAASPAATRMRTTIGFLIDSQARISIGPLPSRLRAAASKLRDRFVVEQSSPTARSPPRSRVARHSCPSVGSPQIHPDDGVSTAAESRCVNSSTTPARGCTTTGRGSGAVQSPGPKRRRTR
jgi:hypothetical protein